VFPNWILITAESAKSSLQGMRSPIASLVRRLGNQNKMAHLLQA